jgi:hypothetical protein
MADDSSQQWYGYAQARLPPMADAVIAGDIAKVNELYNSADQKYGAFLKSYGTSLEKELVKYRDSPRGGQEFREGMTFLQLASLSGNPKMVQYFFDYNLVAKDPKDTSKIFIDYRKPPNVSDDPKAHAFDNKTARGIAQKTYDESVVAGVRTGPNVGNDNFKTIYLYLESQGARKRNNVGKVAKAVGSTAKTIFIDIPVAILKAGLGFGGKRRTRKRRVTKMRKARKTRSRR